MRLRCYSRGGLLVVRLVIVFVRRLFMIRLMCRRRLSVLLRRSRDVLLRMV